MLYVTDAIGHTAEAAFDCHFNIQLGVIGVCMVLYISVDVDYISYQRDVDGSLNIDRTAENAALGCARFGRLLHRMRLTDLKK
jgi:hypothetical protein